MQLNLNVNYKGLDGKDVEDANVGKQLANILANKSPGIDPIKAMDWAFALYKSQPIEIDKSDLAKLVEMIKATEAFTNLAKAQLLQLCDIS